MVKLSALARLPWVGKDRVIRDEAIQRGYSCRYGLQARSWKLALKDATETLDKYWQALRVKLKSFIHGNMNLNEAQKHYSYWIIKDYKRIQSLINRDYPKPSFPLSSQEIHQDGSTYRKHSPTREFKDSA
ncbi:MAG: hypothetical protein L0Y56_07405 [Nitrospira sp.]|nr:hypothetical protein [Nitrospira sp.]